MHSRYYTQYRNNLFWSIYYFQILNRTDEDDFTHLSVQKSTPIVKFGLTYFDMKKMFHFQKSQIDVIYHTLILMLKSAITET